MNFLFKYILSIDNFLKILFLTYISYHREELIEQRVAYPQEGGA